MMMRTGQGEYDLDTLIPALAKVLESDSSSSSSCNGDVDDEAEFVNQRPATADFEWLSDSGA